MAKLLLFFVLCVSLHTCTKISLLGEICVTQSYIVRARIDVPHSMSFNIFMNLLLPRYVSSKCKLSIIKNHICRIIHLENGVRAILISDLKPGETVPEEPEEEDEDLSPSDEAGEDASEDGDAMEMESGDANDKHSEKKVQMVSGFDPRA